MQHRFWNGRKYVQGSFFFFFFMLLAEEDKKATQHDETNKMSVHPAKTQISLGIHPD